MTPHFHAIGGCGDMVGFLVMAFRQRNMIDGSRKNGNQSRPYDVAVVVINYNSSAHTIQCLNSICENTRPGVTYQIIVVDNASVEDDYRKLHKAIGAMEKHRVITLARSRINLGFSGGNMLGVQLASAHYYFFLNNDCVLKNDCISILYQFCEENPFAALCSPQLIGVDGAPESCVGYFPTLSTKLFGNAVRKLSRKASDFNKRSVYTSPVKVDVVSGSQMFVRASAFDEIGGFDIAFFLYSEEEDLSLRLHKRGYDAYLVPAARNLHWGGGSTVRSYDIEKEFYISFLYFYNKHYGFLKTRILSLVFFLRLMRKGFSHPNNFKLAVFVLSGASLKHSMRYKQQIQSLDNYSYLTSIQRDGEV